MAYTLTLTFDAHSDLCAEALAEVIGEGLEDIGFFDPEHVQPISASLNDAPLRHGARSEYAQEMGYM